MESPNFSSFSVLNAFLVPIVVYLYSFAIVFLMKCMLVLLL